MRIQAKATSFAGEKEKLTAGHNLQVEIQICKFLCNSCFPQLDLLGFVFHSKSQGLPRYHAGRHFAENHSSRGR